MHDQSPCIDLGQLESVYAPLAESIRRLIDISIRTEAEPAAVAAAKAKIDSAADGIECVGAAGAVRRAARARRPDHRMGQRGGRSAQPGRAAAGDTSRPRRTGVVGIRSRRGLRGPARPCSRRRMRADPRPCARRDGAPAAAGPPTPARSPCVTGAETALGAAVARARLTSSASRASRRSPSATWPTRTASRWKRRASSSTQGSRRALTVSVSSSWRRLSTSSSCSPRRSSS